MENCKCIHLANFALYLEAAYISRMGRPLFDKKELRGAVWLLFYVDITLALDIDFPFVKNYSRNCIFTVES